MSLDSVDEISEWLAGHGNLTEALLVDLCVMRYGYGLEIRFELVVDGAGRPFNEDEAPRPVWRFAFDAVERVELVGALTPAMVQHPEKINWGLSEVARVEIDRVEGLVEFRALWENERRIEVVAHRVGLDVGGP